MSKLMNSKVGCAEDEERKDELTSRVESTLMPLLVGLSSQRVQRLQFVLRSHVAEDPVVQLLMARTGAGKPA